MHLRQLSSAPPQPGTSGVNAQSLRQPEQPPRQRQEAAGSNQFEPVRQAAPRARVPAAERKEERPAPVRVLHKLKRLLVH
mmetsp:Transcript_43262/g.101760  ORF Transcript_43262/g.101760 Transcript_43262/m.101760 type:complete len:80 (+) Transcript_43262:510-749(+)